MRSAGELEAGSARLLQDGAFQGLQTELEGMGSEAAHGFLLPAPGIALQDTGPCCALGALLPDTAPVS